MAANERELELVLFDLGGVMVRICPGWDHALKLVGCEPPASLDQPEVHARLSRINCAFETGRWASDQTIRELAAATGIGERDAEAALRAWLIEPYPGMHAVLDDLHAANLRTGCLSNTNQLHWSIMTGQGPCGLPLARMHHRFTSFEIGAMKPDAAIYAHAERAAGAAPQQIAYFDDRPENVEAAVDRGWHACRIDPEGDPSRQVRTFLRAAGLPI